VRLMAKKIKGITIEIGGNTQPLNKALEDVNKKSRDLQSELRQVDRLLKLDPKNTELMSQKQKLLAEAVANTKDKLNTLKEAERQVQEQFKRGEVAEEQYRLIQREVIATEQNLKSLEKNHNINTANLNDCIESHIIDIDALRSDDFQTFFEKRKDSLVAKIEKAMKQ